MVTRRGFLGTVLTLAAAPAIVRASSLMPVKVREPERYLIVGGYWLQHEINPPAVVYETEPISYGMFSAGITWVTEEVAPLTMIVSPR